MHHKASREDICRSASMPRAVVDQMGMSKKFKKKKSLSSYYQNNGDSGLRKGGEKSSKKICIFCQG